MALGHTHTRAALSTHMVLATHRAVMGLMQQHQFVIFLICPSSATTAQGSKYHAMLGMFWQEVFPERCTFEKALKSQTSLFKIQLKTDP